MWITQQIQFEVATYVGEQVKTIQVAKRPRTCEYLTSKSDQGQAQGC